MKARAQTCRCHSHNGLLLSPEGLAQRSEDSLELAGAVASRYLDKVGSVSALIEPSEPIFDFALIDEQHRRFLG